MAVSTSKQLRNDIIVLQNSVSKCFYVKDTKNKQMRPTKKMPRQKIRDALSRNFAPTVMDALNKYLPLIPSMQFFYNLSEICVGQVGIEIFTQVFTTLLGVIEVMADKIDELIAENAELKSLIESYENRSFG
jgi:hypothetical protein